jgi:hypothetical protein
MVVSSELAIRLPFLLSLVFIFRLGLDTGQECPTGYKVESPSFCALLWRAFLSSRHSLVHLSLSSFISFISTIRWHPSAKESYPYRVLITSFEPRSYHIDRIQIIHPSSIY